MSEKTYLGDPQAVADLMSLLASDYVEMRLEKNPSEVQPWVTKRITKLADVFLGRDPGYEPMGDWNTAGTVADHIKSARGYEDATHEEIMKRRFTSFLLEVEELLQFVSENDVEQSDYEHIFAQAASDIVNDLLGLASVGGEEQETDQSRLLNAKRKSPVSEEYKQAMNKEREEFKLAFEKALAMEDPEKMKAELERIDEGLRGFLKKLNGEDGSPEILEAAMGTAAATGLSETP